MTGLITLPFVDKPELCTVQSKAVFIDMEKKDLRSILFRHLDGIVTLPVLVELHRARVLHFLNDAGETTLDLLSSKFAANKGYLNVALRVLASQGFLIYKAHPEVFIAKTTKLEEVLDHIDVLYDVMNLLQFSQSFHNRIFEKEPFLKLVPLLDKYEKETFFSVETSHNEWIGQLNSYIEGCLVGPTIVKLGMSGMFHKYFMEASFRAEEFHKDPESFGRLLDFLKYLGWFTKKGVNYQFTDKGLFFARRAASYGVTVSYLPMLSQMKRLLFDDAEKIRSDDGGIHEIHVDRAMNVWGSGGAHTVYFKTLDDLIIDIFNRPLEDQPKGILDMGCGNGALLQHLYDTIEHRTLRGRHLETHPLFLVGADYNQEALKITRANLIANDIWAKVIWGDIGDPEKLARDLKEDYAIELSDLLNMRTFLDHNRIWQRPVRAENLPASTSSGAYADKGRYLPNEWVEQSLVEHLQKWKPYIVKFGLLVIELHTLPPQKTAANLGNTAATAYDATHGFSDQFILELEVFEQCVKRAGLVMNETYSRKFPDNELANVSIHLIQ